MKSHHGGIDLSETARGKIGRSFAPQRSSTRSAALRFAPLAPLPRSLRSLAPLTRGKVSPYERVTSVSRTDLADENASILTNSPHSAC